MSAAMAAYEDRPPMPPIPLDGIEGRGLNDPAGVHPTGSAPHPGDLVGVGPGRGAGISPARFPGPPSAPDVRVSTHPALHGFPASDGGCGGARPGCGDVSCPPAVAGDRYLGGVEHDDPVLSRGGRGGGGEGKGRGAAGARAGRSGRSRTGWQGPRERERTRRHLPPGEPQLTRSAPARAASIRSVWWEVWALVSPLSSPAAIELYRSSPAARARAAWRCP